MTAKADPGEGISTHDLILSSGGVSVPLILCDRAGKRNPLSFTRAPINRGSLKMYSGTQKYADLEPPWTPVAQSDWSGGRGSKDFDNDESMYYDGYNVNTVRPGEIILGPKSTNTFASTLENTVGVTSMDLVQETGRTYYYAFKYTPASTIVVATVNITGFITGGTVTLGIGHFTATPDPDEATISWSTNSANSTTWPAGTAGTPNTFPFAVAHTIDSGVDHCIVIKWAT